MTPEDIQAIARAHQRACRHLGQREPRLAAQAICRELTRISKSDDFWEPIYAVVEGIPDGWRPPEDLLHLLQAEERVFSQLGLSEKTYVPVLRDVYSSIAAVGQLPTPTVRDYRQLRSDLEAARVLVCDHTAGPVKRTLDWMIGWEGVSVVAGAATAGGNALAATSLDFGIVSWTSLAAGYQSIGKGTAAIRKILGR